jgi:uncharacterized protein DUF4154
MGVLMIASPRCCGMRLDVASLALAVTLLAAPGIAAGNDSVVAPDVAVKAAFIFSFAKFTEWPALASGTPIAVCIVGDNGIADALVETIRGQNINGHTLSVGRLQLNAVRDDCHLLFISDAEFRKSPGGLAAIKTRPVLTVSDGRDFSRTGGIIELYVEGGRVRFAINVDAAERSGLRLSSRLLGLAKVVRDGHVQ